MSESQTHKDYNIVQLTADGLEELKSELQELQEIKLPKIIERVAIARDKGDLSENADYQNARDEQALVESRISEIENILKNSIVIKNVTDNNQIGMGSTVTIKVGGGEKLMQVQIVGEFESDLENNKISSVSPMGKALMGRKKGDTVTVNAPAGRITYLIEEIQ